MERILDRFWGKARPDQNGVAHASACRSRHGRGGRRHVAAQSDSGNVAAADPGFFVALHHIGKFSRTIQALAPEHWRVDVLGPAPGGWLAVPAP